MEYVLRNTFFLCFFPLFLSVYPRADKEGFWAFCWSASTMRLSALLALASKATLPPNYRYGMSRPGSLADKKRNPPGSRRRPVAVEPISDEDWHLFCGDRVRTSGDRVVAGSWSKASLPDL